MSLSRTLWLASAATLFFTAPAAATIAYVPVVPTAPILGPGRIAPSEIPGKEYSHDFDHSAAPPGGLPDPEQVVAWDGSGGTADGVDYSGTRLTFDTESQVDAIAHHNDFLYRDVVTDRAHLAWSHDDEAARLEVTPFGALSTVSVSVPGAGPVALSNGNLIGGAGEVSYEEASTFSPPETQGLWASQPEVNGMPLPRDVDGLEMWGPEPPSTTEAPFFGNADKYSLELDVLSGVSVWNASGTPYLSHATVASVVTALLGPITGGEFLAENNFIGQDAINLDALMVFDGGQPDVFDDSPTGIGGDSVMFSIRQMLSSVDPTGYYATGSEIFVINADGSFGFLPHGGHDWDKAYALSSLMITDPMISDVPVPIDLNALEAITGGPAIPEPTTCGLLVTIVAGTFGSRRRVS